MRNVIKVLRTASGMKQKELAERVGIRANYLSSIEADKREPSLNLLRSIAKALDVPVGFLLWEITEKPATTKSEDGHIWNRVQQLLLEMERLRLIDAPRKDRVHGRKTKR